MVKIGHFKCDFQHHYTYKRRQFQSLKVREQKFHVRYFIEEHTLSIILISLIQPISTCIDGFVLTDI